MDFVLRSLFWLVTEAMGVDKGKAVFLADLFLFQHIGVSSIMFAFRVFQFPHKCCSKTLRLSGSQGTETFGLQIYPHWAGSKLHWFTVNQNFWKERQFLLQNYSRFSIQVFQACLHSDMHRIELLVSFLLPLNPEHLRVKGKSYKFHSQAISGWFFHTFLVSRNFLNVPVWLKVVTIVLYDSAHF